VSLIDLEDATGTCTANNTADTNAVITGTVPGRHLCGPEGQHGRARDHEPQRHRRVVCHRWTTPPCCGRGRRGASSPRSSSTRWVASGQADDGTSITTYNLHLGSTGCTPKLDAAGVAIANTGTCTNLNMMDFSLAAFDASTQKVALDMGQLFKTSDLTKENGGAPGCMSGATDPECPVIFSELQINFGSGSTGLPINGGAAQKIFKAAAK
jgi:hypothetical protein